MVKMIAEQFPCRIIFIQGDRTTKESYLKVNVSTEIGKEIKGFTCDQILIEATGKELYKVPFLILPAFVPSLPIYLLWGEDPTTENTILPHLQKFATRLIFDSECTENLQHFSKIMQQRLQSTSTQVVDMNWARIGGWREILAQTFDSPERFALLATAKSIKITYNDIHSSFFTHTDTQAIYLQAWLASRLEWKFISRKSQGKTQILRYKYNKEFVNIELIADANPNLAPEDIITIEVSNTGDFVCYLKRESLNQVTVQACNHYQCKLPFSLRLPTIRSGRSFMQEIFYQKISGHYLGMLHLISQAKWS
jgi:glucose-6-phosphate dehydrogenase assembly protein OpcA